MSLNSKEVEEFAAKLSYLGGRITSKVSFNPHKYCDLEDFLLEGTLYAVKDERLFNCFEHWVRRFSQYLSPSKMRKFLETEGFQYNPTILLGLIYVVNMANWKILLPYSERQTPKKDLLGFKKFPKKPDPSWEKAGLVKTEFYPEYKKNIRPFSYFEKSCPELYWRLIGVTQAKADFKVITEKRPDLSLYAISKKYKIDKSILYKEKSRLKDLEIF